MKFTTSNICTAFNNKTIGSKVIDTDGFMAALETAVSNHDGSKDREPGQHFVIMPDAKSFVSAGDGLKSDDPNDYIVRHHREGPKMFLKREKAGQVQFLATVVYTREAYLKDPDYDGVEDLRDATHVIVAVIASSGPSSPVTPYRFVHNLAGGNLEYQPPKLDSTISHQLAYYKLADWSSFITKKAKEVIDYWNQYNVVAD